jgi:heme/copper-type cytochrome/quinol oxidase subunit 2
MDPGQHPPPAYGQQPPPAYGQQPPPAYGQPPPGQYPPPYPPPQAAYQQPYGASAEPATGALIIGILAIVLVFFSAGVLGIILGAIAAYLGSQGKKEGRPHAGAAFGLGIAAVVIGLLYLIVVVVILATFATLF